MSGGNALSLSLNNFFEIKIIASENYFLKKAPSQMFDWVLNSNSFIFHSLHTSTNIFDKCEVQWRHFSGKFTSQKIKFREWNLPYVQLYYFGWWQKFLGFYFYYLNQCSFCWGPCKPLLFSFQIWYVYYSHSNRMGLPGPIHQLLYSDWPICHIGNLLKRLDHKVLIFFWWQLRSR